MPKHLRLAAALAGTILALALVPAAAAAAPAPGAPTPESDPSSILVGFQAGVTATDILGAAAAAGAEDAAVVGAGTHVFRVRPGSAAAAIKKVAGRPGVRYAEPNYVLRVDAVPNDPSFDQLWGLQNTGQLVTNPSNPYAGTPTADIDATPAWDVTTGSSTIVIGVVDTGIDFTHPDLAANIWDNPGGVGGCPAGTHGYNAITSTCVPLDDHSHGTHVAGTIGAVGNNGVGVVGVNWKTSLMGLKFLNAAGSGFTADAVRAIEFAVQAKQAGVNVRALNNSWGGGGFDQALLDEINRAGANDILFVAAAGNNNSDNDAVPHYPSSYGAANQIAVAATDQDDLRAGFSNWGATSVDLAAPGVNILSSIPGGQYAYFNGTSMATPHVTGAAALVLAAGNLTTADLKAALLASVDPAMSLQGLVATGGRLNVCKAIPGCVPTHTVSPS